MSRRDGLMLVAVLGAVLAASAADFERVERAAAGFKVQWAPATNRFLVEWMPDLDAAPVILQSSTGAVADGMIVVTTNAQGFLRLRTGLEIARLDDAGLSARLQSMLPDKLSPTGIVYDIELSGLSAADLSAAGISNLNGAAYLENLQLLDLSANNLGLAAGIQSLTHLQILLMSGNDLLGVSELSGLAGLRLLDVGGNALVTLAGLESLSGLQTLYADHNPIENIDALATLTSLTVLDLSATRIHDLGALLENASAGGLGIGDTVYLSGIADLNSDQVAQLRGFGCTVVYP